jgi:hypothetical protein
VRRALVAGAFLLCLSPAAAEAAPRLVLFPTPLQPISNTPPFQPPPTALPNVFRPPIHSSEVIRVGIDEQGRVVSVAATQRLVLRRVGDYRLTVPAPVEDVVAAPGSESSPGQRPGAVLWSGFSPGRKVLSATITLDPDAAAKVLPLRIEVADGSVRLENTTEITAQTFIANGDRGQLAKVLEALRKDPQGRRLGQGTYVRVTGPVRDAHVRVSAPLKIAGRIGNRKVSFVLGGAEPRVIPVQGTPDVELAVQPVAPAALLATRRPTWAQAIRASLTLARVRQYEAPLANPDALGPIAGSYRYRTVAAPAPAPTPPAPQDEGLAAWLIALIAAGAVAAAGGLAVLWANS